MRDRLIQGWNVFFFGGIDSRVYAAIRIAVACMLLIYALILGLDWEQWFSNDGVLDIASGRANIDADVLSLLFVLPDSGTILWVFYAAFCLQSVLLLAGVWTRFQTISLFVLLVSLHHRNNLIWEGGDVLLRLTLFLMIFMPLGARWAVDARRNKVSVAMPAWPLRLLQLQQSFLYFSSVGRKLQGDDWQNGEAVYYASHLNDFWGRLFSQGISPELIWISQGLTWSAIAVELVLAFAVWFPSMRKSAVVIGVAFHLSLELTMNLFLFQWMMILILLTHLVMDEAKRSPAKVVN